MKKKFVNSLLFIILILGIFTLAQASIPYQEPMRGGATLEEQIAMDAEIDAVFGENFSSNLREASNQREIMYEGFMWTRSGDIIVPDFYGGSFIDYDGRLVVLIVESTLGRAYSSIGALLEAGVRYKKLYSTLKKC